jgi:hypothetical protein
VRPQSSAAPLHVVTGVVTFAGRVHVCGKPLTRMAGAASTSVAGSSFEQASNRESTYAARALAETELADEPKARGIFAVVDTVTDPVLELLDDLGATVLLFVKACTWLVRPPFRRLHRHGLHG